MFFSVSGNFSVQIGVCQILFIQDIAAGIIYFKGKSESSNYKGAFSE